MSTFTLRWLNLRRCASRITWRSWARPLAILLKLGALSEQIGLETTQDAAGAVAGAELEQDR